MEKKKLALTNEIEILKKEEEEVKNRLSNLLTQISEIKQKIEELKKVKNELESVRKEFEKKQTLLSQLEKDIQNLKSLVGNISKESIISQKNIIEKSISELKQKIEETRILVNNYISQKSSLQMEQEYLTLQIKSKTQELEELEKKEQEYNSIVSEIGIDFEEKEKSVEEEINKIVQKIGEFVHLINFETDNIQKLMKSSNQCPVCGSSLTPEKISDLINEKEKRINEAKNEIENLKSKKSEKEKLLFELRKKKEKIMFLKEEIKKIQKIKDEINELNEKLKSIPEKIIEISTKLKMEEERLKEMENELDEKVKEQAHIKSILERLEEFENKNQLKESLEKDLTQLFMKVQELEKIFDESKLENLEKKYLELTREEASLSQKYRSISDLKNEKEKRLEEIEKKIEMLERYKKEIEKLERYASDLEIFEKALRETQEIVRRDFVNAINYFMDIIWKSLYPYKDFTSLRLLIDENDYILQLKDSRGIWVNVDGIASGGERTLACLTLRIAMARSLVPHLRWLMLDEPTHNLDEKAVEEFSNLLNEKILEFIDQLFIITHNERLESIINGVIYKFERDKLLDKPTRIIQVV